MQLRLRVREAVPVKGPPTPFLLLPHKCDVKGNLYFRAVDPRGDPLASPVTRFSPHGEDVVVFRLEDAPGFQADSQIDAFAVDLRGNVYLLAFKHQAQAGEETQESGEVEQVIVVYDSKGRYEAAIELEAFFHPGQLVVFRSGEFFASGIKIDENVQLTGEPFAAIFDERGKLIKELSLTDDIEAEPEQKEPAELPPVSGQAIESESNQAESAESSGKLPQEQFRRAISLGAAVSAEDGNVYLMRATPDPIIYAIARDGIVVRRLVLPRPSDNAHPSSTFHVAGGKVVVVFTERDSSRAFRGHVIVEASAETGEVLAHYSLPPEIGGALACYTPNGFTFLATDELGQLVIKRTFPY